MESLARLLQLPGVEAAPPAAPADIQAFSNAVRLRLRSDVADLYQNCDGAVLSKGVLEILSISASLDYLERARALLDVKKRGKTR